MKTIRLFVIAGNRAEFDYWRRQHDISPGNRNLVYVAEERATRGIVGGIYLLVGTAQEHERTSRLVSTLLLCKASEATGADLDEWLALNRRQPLA